MFDTDRIIIRQLEDKFDYALWRIRVTAKIVAKGCNDAISADSSKVVSEEEKIHARNIIVSTLSD